VYERGSHIISSSGRPMRQYHSGRHCAEEGCSTILSIYNPADVCFAHRGEEKVSWAVRKWAGRAIDDGK
jgi:hypothetical protein